MTARHFETVYESFRERPPTNNPLAYLEFEHDARDPAERNMAPWLKQHIAKASLQYLLAGVQNTSELNQPDTATQYDMPHLTERRARILAADAAHQERKRKGSDPIIFGYN